MCLVYWVIKVDSKTLRPIVSFRPCYPSKFKLFSHISFFPFQIWNRIKRRSAIGRPLVMVGSRDRKLLSNDGGVEVV